MILNARVGYNAAPGVVYEYFGNNNNNGEPLMKFSTYSVINWKSLILYLSSLEIKILITISEALKTEVYVLANIKID